MHVRAGAGPGGERLGHERRDRAEPPGELAGHHPEEDQPVGRLEGLGVVEIDLVLVVGVLVVALVDAPAQPVQAVVQRRRNSSAADMPLKS